MDQNRKLAVLSIWAQFQSFEGLFKQCVCLIGLTLFKISARSNNIWGNKSQKIPKKGPFHRCWINQETLKIFNFTTAYPILMKLITDIYIYIKKVFHLAKSWGVIHRVEEGVHKKTHKMTQKISFLAQFSPFLNGSIKTVTYLMHHFASCQW